MYIKLALRNVKRSIADYLLYITTMTLLLAVMAVSIFLASFSSAAGFQAASLPLIITIILIVLVSRINRFMLQERAKEFASYLLLGMNRIKLSQVFFMEFFFIGIICLILGCMIGAGVFIMFCTHLSTPAAAFEVSSSSLFGNLLHVFLYFCLIEIFALFPIRRNISSMQIRNLMKEKNRIHYHETKFRSNFWKRVFLLSFAALIGCLFLIVFLPEEKGDMLISIIIIPLAVSVYAFYEGIFQAFIQKRREKTETIYQGNRLFLLSKILAGGKQEPVMSTVFCMCLFSALMSFLFGVLMFQDSIAVFDSFTQRWMGFVQISLSIIFIIIYFSVLSLQTLIELHQEKADIKIMHCMGKTPSQLLGMFIEQMLLKLLYPAIFALFLLLVCLPLVNEKLNGLLPLAVRNISNNIALVFLGCFVLIFFCYFLTLSVMGKRTITRLLRQ